MRISDWSSDVCSSDLCPLQAHDAGGLRPAAVVADAHAEDAAEGAPDRKAGIAEVEITLLEMLEGTPRFVLVMAGQMHLAVFSDDLAVAVDQDRRVEMRDHAVFFDQFGIAEIEAEAEPARFVEQGLGLRPGHAAFEKAVDLGLVGHEPAREEGGPRQFGEKPRSEGGWGGKE